MIRFISFLLGKQYEPCKSCETLKEQLVYEREEKRQLTNTLLSIVKPKEVEANPVEIQPIQQTAALFSRRRAMLEEKDRQEARILNERKFVAVPDNLNRSGSSNILGDIHYNEHKLDHNPDVERAKNKDTEIENLEKELGIEQKG